MNLPCRKSAIILLLLIAISPGVFGQKPVLNPDSTSKKQLAFLRSSYCMAPSLYPYEPETLKSLATLPDTVLIRLQSYLSSRLGDSFYNSIVFSSGQYVDLQALAKLEHGTTNRKWVVAAYYLCFNCQQLPQESGYYVASIELDAKGNVILPVNLPFISRDADKSKIISWQSATEIAHRNGVRKAKGVLSYSPQLEVMIWCFNQSKSIRLGLSRKKSIYIHANSGAVLEKNNFKDRYAPF